jgi:L-asparaginase
MRNILGIHVTQLSCYGRIWGSFKYEKRIVLARNKGKKLEVHKALDNNVVIIKMFQGSVKPSAIFGIPGLKGIVLETYGSGNAPTEDWFMVY